MAFKFTHSGPVRVVRVGFPPDVPINFESLQGDNITTAQVHGIWRDDFVGGVDRIVCAVTRGRVTELFSVTARHSFFIIVDRGLTGVRLDGNWEGLQVSFVVSAAALNDISTQGETFTLSDDEVTGRFIKAGVITEVKLAARSVGATKLKDKAVTERALKTDSVGSRALQDGAVSTAHLEDGSVEASKLAPDVQVSLGTDKANNDASSINVETWRNALEVGEKDDSVTLPNPGETGKTANTKMVRKAIEALLGSPHRITSLSALSEAATALSEAATALSEKVEALTLRVTTVEGRSSGGSLMGFNSYPVGTTAIVIPTGATRIFYSLSGGGGGGGGVNVSGSAGQTTTFTPHTETTFSASGGLGGSSTRKHATREGARGGQGNPSGRKGQDGTLIEGWVLISAAFTLSVTVGTGGDGGNSNSKAGGSGWCKIWWYS